MSPHSCAWDPTGLGSYLHPLTSWDPCLVGEGLRGVQQVCSCEAADVPAPCRAQSSQFNQSDAQWQAAAVAAYVAKGPTLAKFPDATDFPALGRATPDVSALGEGFQVWTCRTLCIWGG